MCRENEQYYLNTFEYLDSVGKNTWNWSAFFFGPFWLAYRKMYAYSFIALLLTFPIGWIILTPFFAFVPFISFALIFGAFPLIAHILLGIFGNALYYRIVKKRIVKGYHLLENFQPTSIPCGFSCGLLVFVSFIADEYLRYKHFQTTEITEKSETNDTRQIVSDFDISADNIRAYLSESRRKHIVSWIADVIICLGLITPSIILPMSISHHFMKAFDNFEHMDFDNFDNNNERFFHRSHYYKEWGKDADYFEETYRTRTKISHDE